MRTWKKPVEMAKNGCTVYGPLAQRFSGSFAPEDPIIVFDHLGVAEALRDCVARRFKGESFFVRAIVQRDYAGRVDAVMPNILRSLSALDDRRIALEQACAGSLQVNGRPLQSIQLYDAPAVRLMQAAIRLADALVVCTETERRRVQDLTGWDPPCVKFIRSSQALPEPSPNADRENIALIWAPHLPGDVAYAFALALSELHIPLRLASADKPADSSLATWVPPAEQTAALARARLVIDTDAFGCDTALSLARWKVPLVCDIESGAQELIEGVRVFDRKRMSSIFEAAINALGRAPAEVKQPAEPARIEYPSNQLMDDGPLVSIIIPTLDRPVLLRYALRSCRAQTYTNIETIVVVDGGPRLDTLAAEFPEVRFIHMAENNPVLSTNTVFDAATGKYVTMLNDDDLFFPHHVASLVTALERSNGFVAHADVLTAYLRGSDAEWLVYGFESNMSDAADLSSLLVNNKVGATSAMFRRECFPDGAPFDESIPLYRDYELWLRLANRYDLIHVERITSCYTTRNQGSGQQSVMWIDQAANAYEAIYNRYAVANRPLIDQRRAQTIEHVKQGIAGPIVVPAGQIAPVAWPPW